MKRAIMPGTGYLLMAFGIFLLPAATRAQPQNLAARIDSIALAALEDGPIAGLSIAVMEGSETIHAQGYGWADISDEAPATSATVFDLASVTKLITAAAVMTLVEAGKLSLSDDLAMLLPDFPNPEQGRQITLRHLLSHTSGLRDYAAADLERWEQTAEPLAPAFVFDFLRGRPLDFEPGTNWSYSNSGFYLVGLIIERVSGQQYGTYVRDALAEPHGLHEIFLCDDDLLPTHRSVGYAPGDSGLVKSRLYQTTGEENGIKGDGGLCGSVTDLGRLPEALKRSRLLSRAGLAMMIRPTTLAGKTRVDYGLGVRRGSLDGHALWGHTGGVTSYWSTLVHYPDDDVTIAVLVNTDGGSEDAVTIEGDVARVVLKLGEPRLEEQSISEEALQSYTGTFFERGEDGPRNVSLTAHAGRLSLDMLHDERPATVLRFLGNDTFGWAEYPMDRFVFHMENGRARGYSVYHNGIFAGLLQRTGR